MLQVELSTSAAVEAAEYFERKGWLPDAANIWLRLIGTDPYNRQARERFGDLLFDLLQHEYTLGSVGRSRFLLGLIADSFPTKKLTAAYFENLEQVLAGRTRRTTPGAIVLCLGPGRCGSTSLVAAIEGGGDACATHENPPLVYWQPFEEQLTFHIRRFRLLADYFALVLDASHWWLNALPRAAAELPGLKIIGLRRENQACVQSFLNVNGRGPNSLNHWAAPGSNLWAVSLGDPAYPAYPVPAGIQPDTLEAYQLKCQMIYNYVGEYNEALGRLAERAGGRFLLVRTEELSEPTGAARLSQFLGRPIAVGNSLNVGTTIDSNKLQFRF